ncbi:MAG TPA: hypothetical protein PK006_04525 [Saprospiraceae bacterium]|nr:hypothetical protein [Saprospiraceae bacterium]
MMWYGGLPYDWLKDPNTPAALRDQNCAINTHWDQANGTRFNFINFESETPTQLGWYIVKLATDYELFRLAGDQKEMKRSLEEIFLAIQALRRLDMQAQCIFKRLYDKRKGCDNCTVCPEDYELARVHTRLTSTKYKDCDYEPQLDGYVGFFIREDVSMDFGNSFHDSTEQKWNVDGTNSKWALTTPPCSTHVDEKACLMFRTQNFLSQDQIIGILNGFAFIKRYIPADAEVVLCNGERYKPLSMVQKYTKALIERIDNNIYNRIPIPGRECSKATKAAYSLSDAEGGHAWGTMAGLLKAQKYITGERKSINLFEALSYDGLAAAYLIDNRNYNFYLLLETINGDCDSNKNKNYEKFLCFFQPNSIHCICSIQFF